MPPHTRRSDKCGSRRRFQYSIGDAPSRHRCRRQRRDFTLLSILHWRCQKGRRRVSPLYICFSNFQYSIGDANLLGRYNVLDCKDFQYSIGDAIEAFFTPPVTDSVTAFNTPLEMQTHLAGHLAKWLSDHFQYSIGDANVEQLKLLRLLYNRFQYSIGDAPPKRSRLTWRLGWSTFNTPLEMPVSFATWCLLAATSLSILHWRCQVGTGKNNPGFF